MSSFADLVYATSYYCAEERGESLCHCKRKPKVDHYLYLVECTLASLYALLHAVYFPPQLFLKFNFY